ncbi:multicopper oxidase domain-containing protein [Panacibacter ginsenosidivorans]|nr:multicopper oxidase domain-containing protein [Panacibacter ginsenosidivorans]
MKLIFLSTILLACYSLGYSQHKNMEMPMPMQQATQMEEHNKLNTVVYHLYIGDTIVNYTGKQRHALAINGSIPAPTLYFTEGDTALIYVHNNLKTETSLHWHGLILPNQYDGVSYLTTAPIGAGQTHVFKFPLKQSGTYWYHSHTMLQQQSGLYGAFIIHKKNEKPVKEFTMLLSDWTDEQPYQVDRSLHNATDWYAIKKGSTQNYAEAIKEGYFKTKFTNEWKRMMAMDVSDVAYDKFFINGKVNAEASAYKAGDSIRLHIINGSSSTYFWLQYAGGKMSVVANDGMDVEPVEVDRMIIAVAETYDVVVVIPEDKSFELRATSEDRTNATSLWLGSGTKVNAAVLPKLKYFEGMKMMNSMMKMDGSMDDMGMQMSNQVMDMNTVMYPEITGDANANSANKAADTTAMDVSNTIVTLNYSMLRSPVKTTLPDAPMKVLHFNLTGNMNRYVWSINNETVSESDEIKIKKGENVRIILYNGTMMRHPMHFHGHFFRVLNGQGDYSPFKNTLDIMPMETDTLEFAPTETGDWFFHCHILYHMMSGMGRIFTYENSFVNPEVPDREMALKMIYMDDRKLHPFAKIGLESNGSDGEIAISNTRYRLQTEWRIGLNDESGYESETHFGKYIGSMQLWMPYAGWDFRYRKITEPEKNIFGQSDTKDTRKVFCAGVQYTLPMLIIADTRIDTKGKFRLQLSREDIPLTNRLRFNFMVNTDKEYMAGFRYIVTKYVSLSTHYDSDMGYGAGITFTY